MWLIFVDLYIDAKKKMLVGCAILTIIIVISDLCGKKKNYFHLFFFLFSPVNELAGSFVTWLFCGCALEEESGKEKNGVSYTMAEVAHGK